MVVSGLLFPLARVNETGFYILPTGDSTVAKVRDLAIP